MEKPLIHNYKLYYIHPFIYEERNYPSIIKCLLQEESQWSLKIYHSTHERDQIRTEYFLPHIIKFLYPTMYLDDMELAEVKKLDFHALKDLTSLDFSIKPGILEQYEKFQVFSEALSYNLSFENIQLKVFNGGVGFLYFSLRCQQEEVQLNDLIHINQLIRPIKPLYEGYPLAKLKFEKNASVFSLNELLNTLLSEVNNYDAKERIYNIYIDRLIFYTYACVKKDSLASNDWIYKRKDLLEALRSCSLFNPTQESLLLLNGEDAVYFSRHKSSVYGFSKEGGVLLSVDKDLKDDPILPNTHPSFIPNYFSTYYLDILLLGLYQRISLINFCRKLSMLKSLIHKKKKIEHIRFEILKFTNTAWFTQISNSELGMAIWKHWLGLFENETLYSEAKQGLDELDDFLENKRQNRFNVKLGVITAFTIPPTLIFSYVSNDFEKLSFRNLLHPKFLASSFFLFTGMIGILFLIDKFYGREFKR